MVPAVKCVIFWHHVDTAGVLWENQCHVRLAEFQSRVKILSLSRKRNADKIWQAYAVRFAASNIRNVITRSAITPTSFLSAFLTKAFQMYSVGAELEASCHWKGTSQACLPASHGDALPELPWISHHLFAWFYCTLGPIILTKNSTMRQELHSGNTL